MGVCASLGGPATELSTACACTLSAICWGGYRGALLHTGSQDGAEKPGGWVWGLTTDRHGRPRTHTDKVPAVSALSLSVPVRPCPSVVTLPHHPHPRIHQPERHAADPPEPPEGHGERQHPEPEFARHREPRLAVEVLPEGRHPR